MKQTDLVSIYKPLNKLEMYEQKGTLFVKFEDIPQWMGFSKSSTLSDIQSLDKHFGIKVHETLKNFYKLCDGCHIGGTYILSITNLKKQKGKKMKSGFSRELGETEIVFANTDVGQIVIDLKTGKLVVYDTDFPDEFESYNNINAFLAETLKQETTSY